MTDTPPAAGPSSRLAQVRARIAAAAQAAGRDFADVTLVAVSKQQPRDRIAALVEAGQRVFGENRVQEAQWRWPEFLETHRDLEVRMIGPLQSNKAVEAAGFFHVVETLDRPKLARALAEAGDRLGRLPRLYIQVNTGEEPQKAGVPPHEVDTFVEAARGEFGLRVEGLMCIPPADEEPAMHFALLAKIARRNGLAKLSMGMSADYEKAVRFGATSVRVGSAIFGERGSA